MKVLQINKYHYMRGGSERVFFNTMSLLEHHGHEVAPFATAHPNSLSSPYDKYFVDAPEIRDLGTWGKIKALPRFFWSHAAARQLELLLQDFQPDIAHLHNIFNGLSLSILPVLHRHNIPVVITLHDPRFVCPGVNWKMKGKACDTCHKHLFLNCLTNNCCDSSVLSLMGTMEMLHKEYFTHYEKYIDRYIFLNNAFRREMSREHPYMEQRGVVLPNFAPKLTMHNSKRGNYYLFYGRLSAEKGVATFVEMARSMPDTQFVVAGSGDMEEYIRQAGLPNIEMRGFISGQRLTDTITQSSAILVPSECMDNNPMTIIEAYSYGKPVVATTLGGMPDMVIDGETGYLIKPFAPTELAQAVGKLERLTDSEYDRMSLAARDFARRHFNEERYYQRLMEIYNEAIAEHK